MFLKRYISSRRKSFSTPWNEQDRVWGSTTIRSFERCWKSAQHPNEMIFRRCKMSWAVPGDVGERGPAINTNVFTRLQNIHTSRFFKTEKKLGRVWGNTTQPQIRMFLKRFVPSRRKRFFNNVKWAGPCLGEHERPFIWTLLKVCTISKRNDSSTPRNELGRDRGCWRARPSHKLECFYMAA